MAKLEEAIKVFNQGGIVIFPTDTAFGIGCRVDKAESIERLFTIRKRPKTQAMSLLVADIAMAKEYVVSINADVMETLVKPFWPGALTIVLAANMEKVPASVLGGGTSVGVRMPNHRDILSVITRVGVPILGPSANFHGEKTPFRFEDLNPELTKQVDYVLEGACSQTNASTVIDCESTPWNILRQGAVIL